MSHFPAPPGRSGGNGGGGNNAASSPRGAQSGGYSTGVKNPRVARLAGFNDLLRELASAKGGSSGSGGNGGAVGGEGGNTNNAGANHNVASSSSGMGGQSSQRAVGTRLPLPVGSSGSTAMSSMPTHHNGAGGVSQMLMQQAGVSPRGGGVGAPVGAGGGGVYMMPQSARAPDNHHHADDSIPALPNSARHLPPSSNGIHFGHSYQQQRVPPHGSGDVPSSSNHHHSKSSFLPTLGGSGIDESPSYAKNGKPSSGGGGGAAVAASLGKYVPKPPVRVNSLGGGGGDDESAALASSRRLSAKNKAPKPPQMPNPASAATAAASGQATSSRRSSAVQPMSQRESLGSNSALQPPYLSSAEVLDRHGADLTPFERVEIKKFSEIYYFGAGAKKIEAPAPSGSGSGSTNNYGYDDDQGDYKVVQNDHVNYRFKVLTELGRGSFGQVSKAIDCKTQKTVALKIIKNKKKFHDQAVIEVEILKLLRDRDPEQQFNVVKMVDSFVFRAHMMVIFELQGMNLYELCKAVKFNPLPMPSIRQIAHQMLATLYYTRELKIVHCDLKPENVLLCLLDDDADTTNSNMPKKRHSSSALAAAQQRSNAQKPMLVANGTVDLANPKLRVIDFGSSCHENKRMYTYIQSRFYRAPEVMLGIPYTPAIDMWSFGCILAELANGYPIFPGENEADQMACIMEFMGAPPQEMIEKSPRRKYFFDTAGTPIMPASPSAKSRSKQTQRPLKARKAKSKDLGTFLRSATKERDTLFADFVASCLEWDPSKRWSPQDAVRHPWMQFAATTPPFPPVEAAVRSGVYTQDSNSRHSTPSSVASSKPATTRLPKIGR